MRMFGAVEGRGEIPPHAGQRRTSPPRALSDQERLAAIWPTTFACMHGPAWRGDGAALLRRLATRLAVAPAAH
jgi:hypothetical protein